MTRIRTGVALVCASLALAACGGDDDDVTTAEDPPATEDDTDDAGLPSDFTVGFAEGGHGVDWMVGQGTVARALSELRGWDYIEFSNEGEGPQALQNAELFIQDGVDVVLTFSGDASVNPAIADTLAAADIPVITYDINQDGWYFVGVDNELAGRLGGEALGQLASDQWDCEVDLVIRSEATEIQPVNEWRVGGMLDGLRSVCEIDDDIVVSLESDGLTDVAQPASRDVLAANPDAERILVIGINDESVMGTLQAAEQLGRDDQIMGFGQGGSSIGGDNVHPALMGSVYYFLEGYPTYAFEQIVDKLAAGEEVPVKDTPEDPAVLVEPCLVMREGVADIPSMDERIEQLATEPPGTHMNDLFCPTAE